MNFGTTNREAKKWLCVSFRAACLAHLPYRDVDAGADGDRHRPRSTALQVFWRWDWRSSSSEGGYEPVLSLQTGRGETHCSNLLSGSPRVTQGSVLGTPLPRVLRFTFPVRLLESVCRATLPVYVEAGNTSEMRKCQVWWLFLVELLPLARF